MTSIHIPLPWQLKEQLVTPESFYWQRRQFLQAMGFAAGGLLASSCAVAQEQPNNKAIGPFTLADYPKAPGLDLYPAKNNENFKVGRPLTDERTASKWNNFYEFTLKKDVYRHVRDFQPYPWTVEIAGLCDEPHVWDMDSLIRKFGIEERIYRFRCVEAWSMVVPWSGIPLGKILASAKPQRSAKYVRMLSFNNPEQAPGQAKFKQYTWPYYEALTLEEAMHPLAFVATGIYGHPLPKQHGAPFRMVIPWKYGYKGAKSVVRLEFTDKRPATFWNDAQAREYGWTSNVNPKRDHPRWSQATERVLDTNERIDTLMYNGYEQEVAALYPGADPH